jgi:hypothetical protein
MRSVSFNNLRLTDITPSEYESLCLLLPYWGLQISEDGEEISGALSTFMLGIHGLSQQKYKELVQLLQHTGITLITDDNEKCNQRLYVDVHENHPMPLAIKTPDRQLYYLNPSTKIQFPVQSAIHKGITLKRKDGPLFLAVQPAFESQMAEWISYLVIQSFLRFSFESLSSLSESTYISCVEKVLRPINNSFAANQMPSPDDFAAQTQVPVKASPKINTAEKKMEAKKPETVEQQKSTEKIPKSRDSVKTVGIKEPVPAARPLSANGLLINNGVPKPFPSGMSQAQNAMPIKPFKSKNSETKKEHTIQPFQSKKELMDQKSVIRPFQSNQNTPSSRTEYNANISNIFRKRRDGK